MTDDADYVTLMPAVAYQKFCVAVMKYSRHDDGYSIFRCSQDLPHYAAQALAKSWAATMRLEIR